jgi:hypothetical protein
VLFRDMCVQGVPTRIGLVGLPFSTPERVSAARRMGLLLAPVLNVSWVDELSKKGAFRTKLRGNRAARSILRYVMQKRRQRAAGLGRRAGARAAVFMVPGLGANAQAARLLRTAAASGQDVVPRMTFGVV